MTTTTQTTYFAAIGLDPQAVGAVYGTGTTEEAAIADAREQAGQYDGPAAEFAVAEMTPAAYAYVQKHGGAPDKDLSVTRKLVCLRDEEE